MTSRFLRAIASLGTITAGSLALPHAAAAQEQCVIDAWDGFNRTDYLEAIRAADRCIDEFGRAAARMQDSLVAAGIPEPPVGAVSDAEKNRIFRRGLLNDVATAYFIKGRSAEYLFRAGGADAADRRQEAHRAYGDACALSFGRTWDARGWFWSPCEAANDRLAGLGVGAGGSG